jgi:hypothetical protein
VLCVSAGLEGELEPEGVILGGDYDRGGRGRIWIEEGNIRMRCGDLRVKMNFLISKRFDCLSEMRILAWWVGV